MSCGGCDFRHESQHIHSFKSQSEKQFRFSKFTFQIANLRRKGMPYLEQAVASEGGGGGRVTD